MTADAVPDMTISISFGAVGSTGSVSAGRTDEAGPAPMQASARLVLQAARTAHGPRPLSQRKGAIRPKPSWMKSPR